MSLDYSFRKKDIPFETWLEKIDEVVVSGEEREGCFRELLLSSMLREDADDDGSSYAARFLVDGSIRGVLVTEEDDEILLKLHSFASRIDHILAARMAWEAMNLGATVCREDDGEINADHLSEEALDALHREWFSISIRSMKDAEGLQLPIYEFLRLKVEARQLDADHAVSEQKLASQLRDLADSFLSSRMVIRLHGSTEYIAGILQADMKTLLFKDTQVAIISEVPVFIQNVVSGLGSQVIDGGDCWVFPPTSLVPGAVLETITAQNITSAGAGSSGGPSAEDWKFIAQGPVIAFLMVAAADGNVDEKEVSSFGSLLGELSRQQDHPQVARMMQSAVSEFQDIIKRLLSGKVDPAQLMKALNILIDNSFSEQEARVLKASIFLVAKEVASSSGGFMGFGPKISKSEKMALGVIASLLGLVD